MLRYLYFICLAVSIPFIQAAILSDTSCVGRCGAALDATKPCQCNTQCVTYGDCCSDYYPVCVATCSGRCNAALDSSKPCQCNSACERYGDCCADYQSLCIANGGNEVTCGVLTDVTEFFWSNDVNRLTPAQYTINWQTMVAEGNTVDKSPNRFFTSVNEAAMNSRPTISAFLPLLNNYNTFIGSSDFLSTTEWSEIDNFYNLIRQTPIFNKLYEYLLCRAYVSSEADFKTKFYRLWFNLYPRSSSSTSILDSSGFEHAMVGELRVSGTTTSISGFHSWIQFYEEEKSNRIDYYGYVRRVEANVVGANFVWLPVQSDKEAVKALGSFFIGTSPEFDLALYTVCAFAYTDAICTVSLGGVTYRIQTWDIAHVAGLQIGSSYPNI